MGQFSYLVRLALLAAGTLATTQTAEAAPPEFDSRVSSDTITLDQAIKLEVTLARDTGQAFQSYTRPEPKDFEILSQAQTESTRWTTFTKGKQTTRTIEQHVYMLRPRHKGPCTVPAAIARIDGKEWKTHEFVVKVLPAAAVPLAGHATAPQFSGTGAGNSQLPGPASGPSATGSDGPRAGDDFFVEAHADKTSLYVGEQVVVSWTLYCRSQVLRYNTVAEPKHDDFWSEDLYQPPGNRLAWERQTVGGEEFLASVLLKRALFPLRAGKLTIGSLSEEVTTMQTAFLAGGSAVRGSKALVLDVLPLPAAGRPEGYETPVVGHYEVLAAADNVRPKAGEAITYRVVVKGEGNLSNLKLPKIERLDGFKVYEPSALESVQRTEHGVEGTKILTYLLLPRKGGELAIPPFELHYFDSVTKTYATAATTGINITVLGDPEKIGIGAQETKENLLAPKIRLLRSSHHVETHMGERVLRGPAMLATLLAPPLSLLSIVVASLIRARLRRETEWSKRRRARAAGRRRMRTCELHIRGQRPSKFFAECARSLYEHLEYRLGMKVEACTVEQLRDLLVARGSDAELALAITNELEACDFARFAASASGPGEMRAALRRVRQLLLAIERAPMHESVGPVAA